ncbi:MAG: hypothetical protein AB7P14_26175 [Blastocatellales bacterium]
MKSLVLLPSAHRSKVAYQSSLLLNSEDTMKPIIRLIEDENYPVDDIEPEYDFAELQRRAQAEDREYRGLLSGKLVRRPRSIQGSGHSPKRD